MNLFFIGDHFYRDSGTMMSPIYEVGTKYRSDWGKVQIALGNGEEVHIRQATSEEMAWANNKLVETIRKNKE